MKRQINEWNQIANIRSIQIRLEKITFISEGARFTFAIPFVLNFLCYFTKPIGNTGNHHVISRIQHRPHGLVEVSNCLFEHFANPHIQVIFNP